MTATALVLGVALAVAAVVLVALPFLREPVAGDDRLDASTPEGDRALALSEERDRALAALKELEFDHRTGKIVDDDYAQLVGPLRRAAARALRALDDLQNAEVGSDPTMTEPTVPEPGPPPGEGTPPTPALVPEPYPPPHEASPPLPDPAPKE